MGNYTTLIWTLMGCAVLNTLPSSARNYEKMWKEVTIFQQNDLPQSALKSAKNIFRKAMDDNNKGEMMKAYLYMLQMRKEISADSLQPDIKRLEQMTNEATDSVERAVLNSLLGSLYASNSYRGKYTDAEVPHIPEDMNEWSYRTYYLKAKEHFTASLSNIPLLSHTTLSAYLPIIQKGNADRYLGDNLLDVLNETAVASLKERSDTTFVRSSYAKLINYYAAEGNKNGIVLATLRKLDYEYNKNLITPENYTKEIKRLIADNASAETCAECYIALGSRDELWDKRHSELLAFIQKGIEAYPHYERINALKVIETNLKAPVLNLRLSQDPVPEKPFKFDISWSNLSEATIQIYRINNGYSPQLKDEYNKVVSNDRKFERQKKYFLQTYTNGKPVLTKTYRLEGKPYELNKSTYDLPSLKAGVYLVTLTTKNAVENGNNWALMPLSGLCAISQDILVNGEPTKELRIVDVISGKPQSDASVILYNKYDKVIGTLHADKHGIVRKSGNFRYQITSPEDNFSTIDATGTFVKEERNTKEDYTRLYTDRPIYRPGQTVKVAGIAFSTSADTTSVIENANRTVTLASSGQKLGEKKVTTNEYGSFSTEFVLPTSCLPGIYNVSTEFGNQTFRVEEYKRPTFQVTFEKLASAYKAGDSISVVGTAKTYAGIPLQNTKVTYTIHVESRFWRSNNQDLPADISGTTTTDNEGHFIVPIRLMNIPEKNNFYYCYEYNIKAQTVSEAGEAQEGTTTLPLSNRSLYISINGLGKNTDICKENIQPITINVRNLQNLPVACTGTYTIIPLKENGQGNKVTPHIKNFSANITSITEDILQLPSGDYHLIATIKEKINGKNVEVTDTTHFVLYSITDVHPPVKTDFWYKLISDEISLPYSPAPERVIIRGKNKEEASTWLQKDMQFQKEGCIQIGSSLKNVFLFYRLYNGDKCVEDRQILLNDSIMTFTYPYKPEYKNGLRATFSFVKDGKAYQKSTNLFVVRPDKKLTLAWDTFRDKLIPGQQENWTLAIARNDRKKFDGAEVLASMYDASLDKFASSSNWNLAVHPWKTYCYSGRNLSYSNTNNLPYLSVGFINKFNWKYAPLTFSKLTIYPSTTRSLFAYPLSRTFKANSLLQQGAAFDAVGVETQFAEIRVRGTEGRAIPAVPPLETQVSNGLTFQMEPRSNFNETAFFYPQLHTNKEGTVSISFTLPDALTKWNFHAIAHTKDMLTGVTDTTITASKDFMIQPNLPRYTRAGDKVSFPATLTNYTNKNLSGIARMEILNPENSQVIYTESQRFSLLAGKVYGLNFNWNADGKYPAVICKIQAACGNKSDGEQNWVPILDNREYVTESIALAVNGKDNKKYNLKNLFQKNDQDAKDRRLTIEFTSNPVWYAIQALPTMAEGQEKDALSLSSAFYAESLAQYIVSQYPTLRTVFNTWRQERGTGSSLWSNLQKNQDLKTIVLNETPWMAEANSETERKQRLATLFDANSLTYKLEATLNKLRALQQEDGSWCWYHGMQSNDYTTLSIAEQLARLEKMTGHKSTADELLNKAVSYLDGKVKDIYKELKQNKIAYSNNHFVLRTYYVQALTGRLKKDECATYFLNNWAKHPGDLSNEDKARCAIIMKAVGNNSVANNYINSLLEHTVQTDELGRYFDFTTDRSYLWEDNRIPTQTLAIEALKENGNYQKEITEMSQWLLKQKQTQAWANDVQSANSIYALLIGNASQTINNQSPATISINGTTVNTDKDISKLGYIHYTYNSGEIVQQPLTLTIEKATPGIAWGGIYSQYTMPLEKIVSSTTANDSTKQTFNIRREFYIERIEKGKAVRYPLQEVTAKVGDHLISRIVVKTDRDMEFIQIKDARLACTEPANSISGYKYQGGIGYYEVPLDASTEYFCDRMNKGTYIFENTSYIDRTGTYISGLASVQCAYAPEFVSRTEPIKITVR